MTNEPAPRAPSIRRLLPLGIILVVAVSGFFLLRDTLSFQTLQDNRDVLLAFRDQNYVFCVIAFMLVYIVIVAFSLPGAAIASLTGGFLFGLVSGTVFNVVSASVGAGVIFLAARFGLGEVLSRKMAQSKGAARRLRDNLAENEISYLLLMRLVPAVPFFVANLVPALVGVTFWRFILTTFFGIIPGAIVFTWAGVGLGDVFQRGGSPDLGLIFDPKILTPILALSALVALPAILKTIKKMKAA